jgi:hypothetical protein
VINLLTLIVFEIDFEEYGLLQGNEIKIFICQFTEFFLENHSINGIPLSSLISTHISSNIARATSPHIE